MNSTIWDRDRAYRRRLWSVVPISATIVSLLFLTSDRVSIKELEKHIGWKGELQVMPEITILDENTIASNDESSDPSVMSTVDLDLWESPEMARSNVVSDESREEINFPEFREDEMFEVQTIRSRQDVPYSRDYVILKMVEPEYPKQEKEDGIEGNVMVELFVNEHGRVVDAAVLSAVGPKSFEESSLHAVRQFVFQPPVENGRPSSMWIKFVIKFRIYS